MNLIHSFKRLFQSGNSGNSGKKQDTHCEELLRFIAFAQKTKPLMGGNYGMTVSYSSPKRANNEFTADVFAEFGFYDFDYIKFARNYALKARTSDTAAKMVNLYYNNINKEAGLSRSDWPYGMDVYDFARMLTNSDSLGYSSLISDQYNEDIFKLKIKVGFATQNGIAAYKLIEQECRKYFPNLQYKKYFATADGFLFTIKI